MDKKFMKINEYIKNSHISLHIEEKTYVNIQEIININYLGEIINEKRKILEPNTFAPVISQDFYFIINNNEYIIIQIILFKYGNLANKKNFKIDKIEDNICIKQITDQNINQIETNKNIEIDINSFENINYELISVIFHHGSPSGGHYVNYSKQIDKDSKVKWIYYSDSTVNNNVNINNIQIGDHTPYLFLYKRISV